MDSISIKGYKSFKDFKLELRPINVLIGANGAGKSNFLSFFEFLNRLYDQKLKEYVIMNGGATKFRYNGEESAEIVSANIHFGEDCYSFKLAVDGERFLFLDEELFLSTGNYNITANKHEAEIKYYINDVVKKEELNKYRGYLSDIKKYHFHDTGRRSPFARESSIKTGIYYMYEQGDNLAAFLYNIRQEHTKTYNLIRRVIQSIAPYFSDFYFKISPADTVRLLWQDKYSSAIYDPISLSDGTIRFIALATLFLQPKLPGVIVIDEPELGLHPQAIVKLSDLVKSAAARGTQVILATQSTDLISQFSPEDIVTVNQTDTGTTMERLSSEKLSIWLDDYSIGDLWKQSIIRGGQPQ